MRTVLILALLLSLSCDQDKPQPAPATASQTTAAPQKNVRALPPGKQVLAYYDAMAAGRIQDAYEMVHEPDRQAKSLDDFRTAANDLVQVQLLKKRTYEIKDVEIDGKTARVDVNTTGPDVAKAQKQIIPQLTTKLAELGQKPTSDMLKRALIRALEEDKIPSVVTNNTLYLAQNEAGEWKLDFDWDQERPGREVPFKRKVETDTGQ